MSIGPHHSDVYIVIFSPAFCAGFSLYAIRITTGDNLNRSLGKSTIDMQDGLIDFCGALEAYHNRIHQPDCMVKRMDFSRSSGCVKSPLPMIFMPITPWRF